MSMDLTELYQIKVRGRLDARWSDWFGGLAVTCEVGGDGIPISTITGPVADQAALRGILSKLLDLNLKLVSVIHINTDWKERNPARYERRAQDGEHDADTGGIDD